MLAAGLLKLGFLTRFISNAVLRGFITGIGVFTFPAQGRVGDPGPGGNPLPSYRRGWRPWRPGCMLTCNPT